MYRGNMQDFCDRVDSYLRKEFDCRLIFGDCPPDNSCRYFVAFFRPEDDGVLGYEVFDREDFEEQVYDYVNANLEEDVQGEHDGFCEQPEELLGEELPETED